MASLRFSEGLDRPPVAISSTEQLLPNIVDGMASTRPNAIYAEIPNSFTSYDAGYRKVSYRHFANAVNSVAWLLTRSLGGRGRDTETLAYIGPNDIGYIAVFLGASKAGYSTLCPSPKLSAAEYAGLMAASKCTTILTLPPPYAPAVETLINAMSARLRIVEIPTIYALLDQPSPHFPYPYRYDSIKDQPLILVHTSGTTGIPKVLTYTHAGAAAYARALREPPPDGYYNSITLMDSNRVLLSSPFFHCAAIFLSLFAGVPGQTTIVQMLAGVPTTITGIEQALGRVDVDAAFFAAPYIEQIGKAAGTLELVTRRVKAVGFAGADLSEAVFRALAAAGVRICNCYGSTEAMMLPPILPLEDRRPEDYHYLELHPYNNARFEARGGFYEMVLARNPEPERLQPAFKTSPHLSEYRTGDLFSPHPESERLWRFEGRADEMIVMATGAMCNPLGFEKLVSRSPDVAEALMVGTARLQNALLIEPAGWGVSRQELLDRIWPVVQTANDGLAEGARVARTHVLFTQPDKPLPRAGKGTVQRAPALKLYGEQINDLYREQGDGVGLQEAPLPLHLSMREMGVAAEST